jgi:hypothetical protein
MNTYSNGWGHLIVTLAVLVMCTTLLVLKVVAPDVVMGLLGTVVAFWFLSGSSKFQQPATPDTPTTPGPPSGGTLP